jgi:hypothetical protein
MEKVITNELTRVLLFLAAGMAGLAAVTSNQIAKAQGSFKPHRKATLTYLVLGFLFFLVIALAAYRPIGARPFTLLLIFQAYFLLLGIIHFYAMNQYLAWSGSSKAFLPELLFTVLLGLGGCAGFIVVYYLLNRNGLQYVMAGSIFFFVLPWFFCQTFRRAVAIPPKILKEWFYPLGEDIDEPEDAKMRNLRVISFEFQKRTNDPHFTNFRAKAPADMDFGLLFYYFINDYNERHGNGKIEISDPAGAPHGWVFYKKSRWYTVVTNYIDAEKTIHNNRIRENDVIICARYVN